MRFSALLFDMDGLLVDSEPLWHTVETELIEACGYRYTDDLREAGVGMRVEEFAHILQRHYPKLGETPQAIAESIVQALLAKPPSSIRAMPGADAILRYAAARNIPRAIASSSQQVVIEHFTRLMGWQELLPLRFSAQFVARGKPAPDIYLHAAAQLGIPPSRCLVLEDSRAGTQAALSAGMTCFTVPDSSHSRLEDYADLNPQLFSSLHDVLQELRAQEHFA